MNTRAAVILVCCCSLLVVLFSTRQASGGPARGKAGKFALGRGDVVVFTGGEDVVASQKNGYLEMLLLLSCPGEGVRFRNMGWEGDTVYEQRRDLNFGSWSNQLQRVGATIVFAQFGQSESLQGEGMLPQFIAAYEKLLNTFVAQTRRVVILSPTPFEKSPLLVPDVAARNDDLKLYVEAIRSLAERRGHQFVDLFTPLRKSAGRTPLLNRDGIHLSSYGHWLAAREIVRQFGLTAVLHHSDSQIKIDARGGTLSPPRFEQLRQTILEKNQLWFDYWRPMNWAFLHGDRIEQPSSRDHRNPKVRWFPQELEKFLPLIEASEREARELAGKISVKPR